MGNATACRRRALLRDAVVETARRFMAADLVEQREASRSPPHYEASPATVIERDDALQELRDALAKERAARGGRRG